MLIVYKFICIDLVVISLEIDKTKNRHISWRVGHQSCIQQLPRSIHHVVAIRVVVVQKSSASACAYSNRGRTFLAANCGRTLKIAPDC
jgi:hypothetical protein